MKGYKRSFMRRVIKVSHRSILAGLMLLAIIATLVISAGCPTPKVEPTPLPPPPPTPVAIGMKFGERYHEIHTGKLQLKCEFCHTNMTETYYDPLAQVSNLADKRACLSCHKEGAEQPFYGEDWSKAKVR